MRRLVLIALLCLPQLGLAAEVENPLEPSPIWDDLRSSIIGTEDEPAIDPGVLLLDAPKRADNPALVPVHVAQPPGAPAITALTLVIDGNPAPVAAEFTFGPALMPLDFEVRVRVDSYSDLRAIATLADGRKVMAGRYVKASGGCAAPAGKSMDEMRATMGEMRFKKAEENGRDIGTLMIRHPNFSGLQRDQVTLLTIPAEFIQTLEVKQDGAELFTMSAGISISEDPVFRFAYQPGDGPVQVHAVDTESRAWDQSF
ncbi:quinoprotein dehydrogenase-associated SoxYZ-like carrier [Paracoccus litorisediminis]|jgi:sulfur-oxidizing protein SoxY|uniref:Quinoprotein dehydrogenase-associated SoxYZ-like carrier n=1 Tax=Paracoccus litorisediminis TaxID=2006130 RepID=A0A844HL88_9RHOB|nr:quinoprotein dehydrogenase-associated SoxYZ-like carrier [Paracoccus litorisediminis]MTH58955.1 quinoprotein dehydrogenase-associated SoxYZ-like carrier [Paracoccus litorisediminis]